MWILTILGRSCDISLFIPKGDIYRKAKELMEQLSRLSQDDGVVVIISDDDDAQWFTTKVQKDGNHVAIFAGWPLDEDGHIDEARIQ